MSTFTTKQNIIVKISQKETRFFKNVLHGGSIVHEHLVFLLILQHSSNDIYVKTVKLNKNMCIFSKRHKCFPNAYQHKTSRTIFFFFLIVVRFTSLKKILLFGKLTQLCGFITSLWIYTSTLVFLLLFGGFTQLIIYVFI